MTILKRAWNTWKRLGQKIGDFLARVVLSVFYFTVFMPFALVVRLFQDPLRQKPKKLDSYWEDRRAQTASLDDARRGF